MNFFHHPLPGPGYLAICQALGISPESNVSDVLAEIARLKMAAAEGPQPASKSTRYTTSTKSVKRLLSPPAEDIDADKETA